jgi:hypothetical protein
MNPKNGPIEGDREHRRRITTVFDRRALAILVESGIAYIYIWVIVIVMALLA